MTNSVEMDGIWVGYNPAVEQVYLICLDIGTWISILAHFFFYVLVFACTPKEMFNYRITVTNTSSWCLAMTIVFGVLIRPVPLLPIPAAKVTGPLRYLGELWGGQLLGWSLGFVCIANFMSAAMNCFAVLAVFLLEPRGWIGGINRCQGLSLGIGSQVCTTAVALCLLHLVYKPTVNLKTNLLAKFPELGPAIADNQTVVFGYIPDSEQGQPQFMAILLLLLFAIQGFIVSNLYVLLVLRVWKSISKGSKEKTARSRRNVVMMLTARMTFPTVFGIFPVMLLCAGLHFCLRQAFGWYCALCAVAISHGFQNVCATIIAYKPYRDGICHFFHSTATKMGLVSVTAVTNSANLPINYLGNNVTSKRGSSKSKGKKSTLEIKNAWK